MRQLIPPTLPRSVFHSDSKDTENLLAREAPATAIKQCRACAADARPLAGLDVRIRLCIPLSRDGINPSGPHGDCFASRLSSPVCEGPRAARPPRDADRCGCSSASTSGSCGGSGASTVPAMRWYGWSLPVRPSLPSVCRRTCARLAQQLDCVKVHRQQGLGAGVLHRQHTLCAYAMCAASSMSADCSEA